VRAPHPDADEAWFTLLDVGQGLSVVVQTARHTLVYDTGMNLFGSNMSKRVVLPFLNAQTVQQLDMLILSHGDNDHSGGAATLLAHLPIQRLLSGQPERFLSPITEPCQAGQQWQWDGVLFEVLHPEIKAYYPKNNNYSCVLRVSNGRGAVLLTGDIEKSAELSLLNAPLQADVLVVPHHGSLSSSSPEFIQAVHPKWALFATGYLNRFGFPKPEILNRYHQQGVETLETGQVGAIRWQLTRQGIQSVVTARQQLKRYWHP
jgi:competence protein ComEC